MPSKRTMASQRIEMNGAWYLCAERAAGMIGAASAGMAAKQDFRQPGRSIIFDGMDFYSETYCQQLVRQKPPA